MEFVTLSDEVIEWELCEICSPSRHQDTAALGHARRRLCGRRWHRVRAAARWRVTGQRQCTDRWRGRMYGGGLDQLTNTFCLVYRASGGSAWGRIFVADGCLHAFRCASGGVPVVQARRAQFSFERMGTGLLEINKSLGQVSAQQAFQAWSFRYLETFFAHRVDQTAWRRRRAPVNWHIRRPGGRNHRFDLLGLPELAHTAHAVRINAEGVDRPQLRRSPKAVRQGRCSGTSACVVTRWRARHCGRWLQPGPRAIRRGVAGRGGAAGKRPAQHPCLETVPGRRRTDLGQHPVELGRGGERRPAVRVSSGVGPGVHLAQPGIQAIGKLGRFERITGRRHV